MKTMLLYALAPGEQIILPRNVHHCALTACVWNDNIPVWVWPRWDLAGHAAYAPEDFVRAMEEHPQARAVLLTRPDYMGIAMDLSPIVRAAHQRGMRVCVDEAHGAHWNWWTEIPNAGAQGADLWIQSAHKTLPALTGGAWLHCRNPEDTRRIRQLLRMVQTSSPSFLIMASLDTARAWMDQFGQAALQRLQERLAALRASLPAGYEDAHDAWRAQGLVCDPTRLVIDVAQRGYTGWEAAQALAAQGVDLEMADHRRLVAICTVADEAQTFTRYAQALASLQRQSPSVQTFPFQRRRPERACSLREAALGRGVWLPLAQTRGRIAATCVGVYPPGIPLVTPGERIEDDILAMLEAAQAQNARCFGVDNGQIYCMMQKK
ncbi:MAG: hypothetical protein RR482_03130, partial [Clostridia bacterium]